MGGGVLLDASHEIDLLRWLAGEVESVFCAADRRSRLKIDTEDTAALVFRFKGGVLGEVHLDMVQRAYRRNLQLVFEEATVLWELPAATLKVYEASTKRWKTRSFALDLNQLYVREAVSFLARAGGGSPDGLVTAEDGARTLAVIEAARRSLASGRMEKVRA
jgi:predicted dehydrogenase